MFYVVSRLFFKGEKETHSMQIFSTYEEARKRYYSIIAADLQDTEITYQMANIVSSDGFIRDMQVFNREEEEAE